MGGQRSLGKPPLPGSGAGWGALRLDHSSSGAPASFLAQSVFTQAGLDDHCQDAPVLMPTCEAHRAQGWEPKYLGPWSGFKMKMEWWTEAMA